MSTSAVMQLLRSAPVLTALVVDFRRQQWSFSLPPQPVGPGDYLVVRVADAAAALEQGCCQDATVLPPLQNVRRRDDGDDITWYGDSGRDEASRRRFCPESWVCSHVSWHPSHWRIYLHRTDGQGRNWSCGGLVHVTNDFGSLVEVAE